MSSDHACVRTGSLRPCSLTGGQPGHLRAFPTALTMSSSPFPERERFGPLGPTPLARIVDEPSLLRMPSFSSARLGCLNCPLSRLLGYSTISHHSTCFRLSAPYRQECFRVSWQFTFFFREDHSSMRPNDLDAEPVRQCEARNRLLHGISSGLRMSSRQYDLSAS